MVKKLLACVAYVRGEPDDPQTYEKIGRELDRIERERKTRGNRLFYLATPPAAFAPIGTHLGQSGLAREENEALKGRVAALEAALAKAGASGAAPPSATAQTSSAEPSGGTGGDNPGAF